MISYQIAILHFLLFPLFSSSFSETVENITKQLKLLPETTLTKLSSGSDLMLVIHSLYSNHLTLITAFGQCPSKTVFCSCCVYSSFSHILPKKLPLFIVPVPRESTCWFQDSFIIVLLTFLKCTVPLQTTNKLGIHSPRIPKETMNFGSWFSKPLCAAHRSTINGIKSSRWTNYKQLTSIDRKQPVGGAITVLKRRSESTHWIRSNEFVNNWPNIWSSSVPKESSF